MNGAAEMRPVRRVAVPAAVVAVLGLAAWTAGLVFWPREALLAYLAAFVYGVTTALGALVLVMITHAAGARWFVVLRRLGEGAAGALPLFLPLVLPILLGAGRLYPWVPPLAGLEHEVRAAVRAKQGYLNVPFFGVRAAVYLALWAGLAWGLRRWSFRQDAGEAPPRERAVLISGLGLLAFGFSIHFAAVDWVMSLSPDWTSTIFGAYVFAGGMVAGISLLVILALAGERGGPLAGMVSPAHYHALGRLLLTFLILWTYFAYAQGFLIWIADVPREARWYVARWAGGWSWVLWALILGHFLLPFLALLSRPLKRRGWALALVAGWLLAFHYVDLAWLIFPSLGLPVWRFLWLDLAALALVLGAAAAFGAWRLAGRPAVPRGDPLLARSLEYESR